MEGLTVLVANEDPHALHFVREALTGVGFGLQDTAEPGETATIARSKKRRLVLLDLMLPGTGGIDLMTEIPELRDLPVIFISGYGRDETIVRAFDAGPVDYIVKPFSPTELTARVRAALRVLAEPFVLAGPAAKQRAGPLFMDACGPPGAVEIRNGEFEQPIAKRRRVQDGRIKEGSSTGKDQ